MGKEDFAKSFSRVLGTSSLWHLHACLPSERAAALEFKCNSLKFTPLFVDSTLDVAVMKTVIIVIES